RAPVFEADHYADYILDEYKRRDHLPTQQYWQAALAGAQPITSQTRLSKAGLDALSVEARLIEKHMKVDAALWQAIKSWCRQQGITPALLFKALYLQMLLPFAQKDSKALIYELASLRRGIFQRTLS